MASEPSSTLDSITQRLAYLHAPVELQLKWHQVENFLLKSFVAELLQANLANDLDEGEEFEEDFDDEDFEDEDAET